MFTDRLDYFFWPDKRDMGHHVFVVDEQGGGFATRYLCEAFVHKRTSFVGLLLPSGVGTTMVLPCNDFAITLSKVSFE
jgi:hypothetical protein